MTVEVSRDDIPEIIPYQELLGNYDRLLVVILCALYYTIPRAIREL